MPPTLSLSFWGLCTYYSECSLPPLALLIRLAHFPLQALMLQQLQVLVRCRFHSLPTLSSSHTTLMVRCFVFFSQEIVNNLKSEMVCHSRAQHLP